MNPYRIRSQPLRSPVGLVLAAAVVSYLSYTNAYRIGIAWLHQGLAAIAGAVYFASIFFGPLYIYIAAYLRGVPLSRRVLETALIPFLWMTKDVLMILESHPLIECLYWYFNPLNIWMVCLLLIYIGGGTLIARAWLRRSGRAVRVITPGPVVAALIGMSIAAGIYAWGQGENIFSVYMHGYRFLFGGGV